MDLKKTFKYAGMCSSFALLALGSINAEAAGLGAPVDSDTGTTFTTLANVPDAIATGIKFGTSFVAIGDTVTVAKLVISSAGVVSTAGAGSLGGARIFISNAAGNAALDWNLGSVTPGIASTDMSFAIGTPNVGTGVSGPQVVLAGAVPGNTGTFLLDTWTVSAPATTETFGATFDGAAGTGTLTLSATGTAHYTFGATLATDSVYKGTYVDDAYTGTVRISVAY
jgi:hypothetical protein